MVIEHYKHTSNNFMSFLAKLAHKLYIFSTLFIVVRIRTVPKIIQHNRKDFKINYLPHTFRFIQNIFYDVSSKYPPSCPIQFRLLL